MDNIADRRPGDPIPGHLVRDFRERNGLTQEQLAERLGVRGGKAVISNWETGKAACEGPAAEFLLHLLGGGDVSLAVATLASSMDAHWARAKDKIQAWRQVVFVPETKCETDAPKFVRLFPGASLQDPPHGFPFRAETLPGSVNVGLHDGDWLGSIPADGQPSYLWLLKRDGRFAYRERLWEDELMSPCPGQIDVWRQVRVALRATHLFVNVAAAVRGLRDESKIRFRLDLEGVRNRALVLCDDDPRRQERANRWSSDHAAAELSANVADTLGNPVDVALSLVVELAAQINPDFADPEVLRTMLLTQKKKGSALGFVDYRRIKGG